MDIDRDLERMIGADLEDWQTRQHKAVFSAQGDFDGTERTVVGSLYVDGLALRALFSGDSDWVTMAEAKHVAERLGVSLQIV